MLKEPELAQVLRGLALNREPGWNFPGNFLEVSFDEVGDGRSHLSLHPGPHCLDADGQVNLGAVALLADVAMGTSIRHGVGMGARLATVSMALQFTGARREGALHARARFDRFVEGTAGRQALTRVKLEAGGVPIVTGSGAFIVLGGPEATAPLPLRKRGQAHAPPLAPAELTEAERAVYARARRALAADGDGSFIERFWGLTPKRTTAGARCRLANGLHVGNRVGHTQGGITVALAAATAQAALGPHWPLVGISAWYVSPGTGEALRARAKVVHRGKLTAVVHCRVVDPAGRTVLEAMASHARGAHAADG